MDSTGKAGIVGSNALLVMHERSIHKSIRTNWMNWNGTSGMSGRPGPALIDIFWQWPGRRRPPATRLDTAARGPSGPLAPTTVTPAPLYWPQSADLSFF